MKKLLLLLVGCLFASSTAFAQEEETETPTITPGWTITAHYVDPSGIEDVTYQMTASDYTAPNCLSQVYYALVELNVYPEQNKDTKVQYTITYTSENGEKTTATQQIIRNRYIGNVQVIYAAWLDKDKKLVYTNSYNDLIIGDGNWTGLGYFPASLNGETTNEIYFNSTTNSYKSIYTLGTSSTSQFLAGGSGTSFTANTLTNSCLNKATIDFTKGSVNFEKVDAITLNIESVKPFVAPINVEIPTGVKVFEYSSYDNGNLTVEELEGDIIPANTPVILKVNSPNAYTFNFSGSEFEYNVQRVSNRDIIPDTQYETSGFYGVHTPHYVPTNGYTFDGETFVPAGATDVITALNCYFVAADEPETISIVFPDDEEESDGWDFTFGNKDDNFSASDSEDGIDGTIALFTEDKDAESISFTIYAPEDIDALHYAWVPTVTDNGDDEGEDEAEQENQSQNDDVNVMRIARYADTQTLEYKEADKADDNAYTIELPFEGSGATGTLYIATKDADTEAYNIQKAFNVSMTVTGPTGVETVESAVIEDNVIYNIFGQKVDATYKGIVIKNGKKYIQK